MVGVVDPGGMEGGEALGEAVACERGALEEGGASLFAEVAMEGVGERLVGIARDEGCAVEETKAEVDHGGCRRWG